MRVWLSGLGRRGRAAVQRLRAGEPGRLWSRLNAVDFYGNSFQLAALAILCFFPFLIVVTAAAGRDAAAVVAGWLGLNRQAAEDVAALFKPGQGSGSLTVASACVLVIGAMAVAGTLQRWYERVFDVRGRGWRDIAAQFSWIAALLAYGAVQATAGRALGPAGGPVLQGLFAFALATLFWWASMKMLLMGAVSWRALFPAALATGVCWMGLGVFSAHFFSAAIIENEQSYGPIGVIMIILSWLVAMGVVIHLGSIVGRMYVERRSRPPG
ncbi:YhjD/YihY/BrkB family envelope integrity protein [Actinoallomurus sp. NPDC050550]|uniref:YhjD/YihY/BrkB family envelope integrity protein n=1 Tax=Actinoallomurus sp. NPDC050550 TaxID=3154937 RepID=UPI0033FCC9A4